MVNRQMMNRVACLVAAFVFAHVAAALAQGPTITSFHSNGKLSWTGGSPDAAYRIEWNSSLTNGDWSASWDELDWIEDGSNGLFSADVPMFYRVSMFTNWVPEGMIEIPEGPFLMGDTTGWGLTDAAPVHTVHVSRFYISKFEVTQELWDKVYMWAITNDYSFDQSEGDPFPGSTWPYGSAMEYPANEVSWYDCVKWCNARSEMESLEPVYYTSATMTSVYRSYMLDLVSSSADWDANGYRLPTEAEWEKVCRAGTTNAFFFGNGNMECAYAVLQFCGAQLSPIGTRLPNPWGLHDILGNVQEWCWDSYWGGWYADPLSSEADTRGPAGGWERVLRGSSFESYGSNEVMSAYRNDWPDPIERDRTTGFRCVRSVCP